MNQEQEEIIIRLIRNYLDQYDQMNHKATPGEIKSDVIHMGANILVHKWELVSYSPGSFVRAFINNDLERTFAHADTTNRKYIEFYLMLCANLSTPEELQNID